MTPFTPARHGLTLLEVLAAVVLLTILITTCVPLLQRAMRTMHDCQSPPQEHPELAVEFAAFAQAVLDNPSKFGAKSVQDLDARTVSWPGATTKDVQTNVLVAANALPDDADQVKEALPSMRLHGMWLKLACDDKELYRWAPLPIQQPGASRIGSVVRE